MAKGEEVGINFETVTSDGVTYTNATVVTKTPTHVTIRHSRGMASLKAKTLDTAAQRRLGYLHQDEIRPSGLPVALSGPNTDPRLKELQERVRADVTDFLQQTDRDMLWKLGALAAIIYLFFCYCCWQLCKKTSNRAGLLVWLPVFKCIPLLRAAGMSPWLFLLLFTPLSPIIFIVWCFRIARVRQKSPLTAIFLLLPGTNILAFLYLALSGHPHDEPPKREDKKIKLTYQQSHQASYG
ncbi:MAG: hypothetical protein L0Y58_10440 [Verrucomicrobia subdivision 3 bacterium]|nr:hypothetical protein [Limisphaerales bacterium]